MTGGRLAPDARALIRISAALATRSSRKLRRALEGLPPGVGVRAVDEVILQAYLFVGYPGVLEAFRVWREVSGGEPPAASPDEEDWEEWRARGEEVCRRIYGEQYEALRENVRALHPDLERWMVTEGYGKVLARPGLSLLLRELSAVAVLAVLGAGPQLHSHLRGSLRVGASPTEVDEALEVAEGYMIGEEPRRLARRVWSRVRERSGPEAGPPGDVERGGDPSPQGE